MVHSNALPDAPFHAVNFPGSEFVLVGHAHGRARVLVVVAPVELVDAVAVVDVAVVVAVAAVGTVAVVVVVVAAVVGSAVEALEADVVVHDHEAVDNPKEEIFYKNFLGNRLLSTNATCCWTCCCCGWYCCCC